MKLGEVRVFKCKDSIHLEISTSAIFLAEEIITNNAIWEANYEPEPKDVMGNCLGPDTLCIRDFGNGELTFTVSSS